MKICTKCNAQNENTSTFCVECGTKIETGRRESRRPTNTNNIANNSFDHDGNYAVGKTPAVSCVLSLLVVGLGQFYNGDNKKGIMMFVGALILGVVTAGIVWLAFAIFSAIDAYQVADGKKQLGQWT